MTTSVIHQPAKDIMTATIDTHPRSFKCEQCGNPAHHVNGGSTRHTYTWDENDPDPIGLDDDHKARETGRKSPEAIQIPGGWAFFCNLGTPNNRSFWGAFFTLENRGPEDGYMPFKNVYHNFNDDDLPITAIIIPY